MERTDPPGPEPLGPAAPAPRRYGGRSREDRVAERRERLVRAGVEVFGTAGYQAATVRGVCAVAGLTDRYFYESFDGLESLLCACYGALMDGLRERLLAARIEPAARAEPATTLASAASTAPTPDDALERVARAGYGAFFEAVRDPRFARIVLHEVLGVSRRVDALYEARTREFAALAVAPLARAAGVARLPPQRASLLGRALAGAAIQVAASWVQAGYRPSRRAVIDTCVLVSVGTLRALGGPAPSAPGRASGVAPPRGRPRAPARRPGRPPRT